jgi:dihydroorotate dehydrogenase electron transfer subunit
VSVGRGTATLGGAVTDPPEPRRTRAPFGRRLAGVEAATDLGAYRVIRARDPGGPPDPRPGQFYMLAAGVGWGAGQDERPYLPRAFSFARVEPSSTGPVLSFLLEDVGPGTERLARLRHGDELWLAGPFGTGFSVPDAGVGSLRALLVGGGIGLAPILALADELGPGGRTLLGFRSSAHAEAATLFSADATALATDDGSRGRHGLVTELLGEELDREKEAEVFACGPAPMLAAVRELCAEREVRAELALESGMACGFGACFGCVVPTRSGYLRLCLDGPVLDASVLDEIFAGPPAAT